MKKKIFLCGLLFLGLLMLWGLPLRAAASAPKALILYEGGSRAAGQAEAVQIANLLGHFQTAYYLMPTEVYQPGELNTYPYVFLVGYEKHYQLPPALLSDLLGYRGRFFWLGNHLEQFLASGGEEKAGLRFLGESEKVKQVSYNGYRLGKGNPVMNLVEALPGTRVWAWGLEGQEKFPYLTQKGDFWYAADLPFSYAGPADRYLVFCDLLHDFLGVKHQENHQALLRIEDVNPTSDPDRIKAAADLLSKRKIPFMIGLVPFYINPEVDEEIPLSSRPRLVEALKYAVSRGATLVMHGDTHQYHGVTTADFEFWDDRLGKPVKEDSAERVEKKLKDGLQECFNCGLYPLVWETPHYAASALDYEIFARHFSTACEQKIFFNVFEWGQAFPFVIEKDFYGQRVLPENLGYIPLQEKREKEETDREKPEVARLLRDARQMGCLRDGVAGCFFHPFLDLSLLEELADGLEGLGYRFIDPRALNNRVTVEDMAVVSGKGKLSLPLKGQYLQELYLDEQGRVRRQELSLKKITGSVERKINCKPGWIYAARGLDEKPAGWLKIGFERWKKKFAPAENHADRQVKAAILRRESPEAELQKDNQAFLKTFSALGIDLRKISNLDELRDENLLIVPYPAAQKLSPGDIKILQRFWKSGKVLILDGFSDAAQALGFKKAARLEMQGLKDLYNGLDLYCREKAETVALSPRDQAVYQSKDGFVLGVLRREKQGGIFFLSTLFDPVSGEGYSRFPTLPNIVLDAFGLVPPQRCPRWEAYFDPGYRQSVSLEVLAQRWRKAGVRVIHAAGWHFYPAYTFDYKRLVSVCHREGIAVYLWLELPYLTQTFWEKHPQFREQNYRGQYFGADDRGRPEVIKTFWRYPLALEDPQCMKAVKAEVLRILKTYNFDGVNLAELYFEGESLRKPEQFAPFHPAARRQFQAKYGYDPREIFIPGSARYYRSSPQSLKQFQRFREELLFSLHRELLSFLTDYKKQKRDFDVALTFLDSIETPEVRELWGIDSARLAGLGKEYPLSLVVEDPAMSWNRPPERYLKLKADYEKLGIAPEQLGIDLNVVECHYDEKGPFAAKTQTGAELFEILRDASAGGNRVLVYAESSLAEYDLPYLAYCLEKPAGAVIPAAQAEALEPLQATWASCDLTSLAEKSGSLELSYHSPAPAYLGLSKEPRGLFIDGEKKPMTVIPGDQEWVVYLPGGSHQARIKGESKLIFEMEAASYLESTLLLGFGLLSCGLLFVLYLLKKRKISA